MARHDRIGRSPRRLPVADGDLPRVQHAIDDAVALLQFGLVHMAAGRGGRLHAHGWSEALIPLTGRMAVRVGRREAIVGSGAAALLAPGVEHRVAGLGPDELELLYIGFTVTPPRPPGETGLHVLDGDPRVVAARQDAAEVAALLDPHAGAPPADAAALLLRAVLRLAAALDAAQGAPRTPARRGALIAARVREQLAARSDRPISVAALARMFYLTPHHLGETFRAETGMTIKRYHLDLRLERAAELLRDGELPIGKIADRLGFDSPQTFARRFAQRCGVSPTRYRQGARSGAHEAGRRSDPASG